MGYIGAAVLILFLLGLTSAGWYWLFKRFERRMSERFDDMTRRVNSNFDILEVLIDRAYDLPVKADKALSALQELENKTAPFDKKLDLLQGLLLVLKEDRALDAVRDLGEQYKRSGRVDERTFDKLSKIIEELRLDNFTKH